MYQALPSENMSHNHQLGNISNLGSEQTNSSEDERIRVSALRNSGKELEGMVSRVLQRVLEPIMEGLIRKVVKEEIQVVQKNILTIMKRNPHNEIHTFESRSLKLKFLNEPSPLILTGKEIKGEGCTSIKVALFDVVTEQVVKSCPEASAKVQIVAIEGGFDWEGDNWAPEEFDEKIVGEKEGKHSLLAGNIYLKLNEGIGYVGNIKFKHDSRWTKKCKVRLGARVVDNFNGTRIVEAKTESFFLKDRRCIHYKKHETPSLSDDVWRLVNIRKGGALYKRLTGKNINTVEDFLIYLYTDPNGLQKILSVRAKMWDSTVAHARKCIIGKAVCLYYYPSSQQNTGVVFNVVGQVQGLLLESQFTPIGNLSETDKADACKAVLSAFEHRKDIIHFDDEASLLLSSHCSRMESRIGHDSEASEMIFEYEDTQPIISSPGIIPSNDLTSDLSVEDFDSHYHMELLIGVPGNDPNATISNPEFVLQDYNEDDFFKSLVDNFEDPRVESHNSEDPRVDNSFLLAGAQAAKAQIRWTMVSSVPRWFSIRRIVTLKGIHVQKKPRI